MISYLETIMIKSLNNKISKMKNSGMQKWLFYFRKSYLDKG